jgi:hypothetical protein
VALFVNHLVIANEERAWQSRTLHVVSLFTCDCYARDDNYLLDFIISAAKSPVRAKS